MGVRDAVPANKTQWVSARYMTAPTSSPIFFPASGGCRCGRVVVDIGVLCILVYTYASPIIYHILVNLCMFMQGL